MNEMPADTRKSGLSVKKVLLAFACIRVASVVVAAAAATVAAAAAV